MIVKYWVIHSQGFYHVLSSCATSGRKVGNKFQTVVMLVGGDLFADVVCEREDRDLMQFPSSMIIRVHAVKTTIMSSPGYTVETSRIWTSVRDGDPHWANSSLSRIL